MAEKFDKLVKIGEEVCKKEFADYENRYREFVTSYTKAIALTATYSAVSNGKSWPKEFFKDSPNPTTFGELFKWMFDKDYGSRYYDQKDVVGESVSVYLDRITGKEYNSRVEAAGRVPLAPEREGDKGLPDDIIEASIVGNEEIKQIYASLRKNYRDTQNYLTYKKILQEITISVYSEKIVKQYLEKVTSEGIRTWTLDKFLEIWRDGLQGKNSMQSDVGIADFVGREYPLYQEVYGGNFWVVIDNPWSKRNNPEGPQALVDAIREKSPDPDAAKGTTASGTTASGTTASDAAAATGPSASTPLKYTPFVEGLQDGYQISSKTDLPDFMIYVSDPKTWKELEPVDQEGQQFDETGEPDEYTEEEFAGLSEEEVQIQAAVTKYQEDSTKTENNTPAAPQQEIEDAIKTTKVSSESALYDLAGSLARKLGKNARVNSENMRKGYTKGIHGLCPQGTQAMLVALTGISGLGQIGGNADAFSFKTPGTGGSNSTFLKKVDGKIYFNDKVKILQENGSWKGTYLDKKSKDRWQVGDVIAMGYKGGKPYGHIQVWTGTNWQSDFKQGLSIQQNNVDPNTVALWRLNENGIAAVNKQMGSIS